MTSYYERLYNAMMADRVAVARSPGAGYEKHHIKPRSLGGDDSSANLVILSIREHVISHWLLTKFTAGQDYYKMLHALGSMTMGRTLSPRQVEACKLARRKVMRKLSAAGLCHSQTLEAREANKARVKQLLARGEHNFQDLEFIEQRNLRLASGAYNLQQPEHKAIVLAAQTKLVDDGLHHWLSEEHSTNTSVRMAELSAQGKNPFQSAEGRAIASAWQQVERACPWCDKIGKGTAMFVHHFDNCLEHPENKGLTRKQIKDRRKQM